MEAEAVRVGIEQEKFWHDVAVKVGAEQVSVEDAVAEVLKTVQPNMEKAKPEAEMLTESEIKAVDIPNDIQATQNGAPAARVEACEADLDGGKTDDPSSAKT